MNIWRNQNSSKSNEDFIVIKVSQKATNEMSKILEQFFCKMGFSFALGLVVGASGLAQPEFISNAEQNDSGSLSSEEACSSDTE